MSTDVNFSSYAQQSGLVIEDREFRPTPGVAIADTLKFSGAHDCTVRRCQSWGGLENAIDLNNGCTNILIENTVLHGGDQAAIVVKGGCRDITLRRVGIDPVPSAWCDILWDDFSDQSHRQSTGLLEEVTRLDGKPVRLVCGRFSRPQIAGGNVRLCYFYSLGLILYNLGKIALRGLRIV
jgi:hypothetical protein